MTDLRNLDKHGEMQYFLLNYPTMLMQQGETRRLAQILLNINFLAEKIAAYGLNAILTDLDLPFCIQHKQLQTLKQILLQAAGQMASCEVARDVYGLLHSLLTHRPDFIDAVARAELSRDTPLPILTAFHPIANMPGSGEFVPNKVLSLGNQVWLWSARFLALARNSKYMAVNDAVSGAIVWDLEADSVYREIPFFGMVTTADFAPHGKKLLLSASDVNEDLKNEGFVLIWDLATNCQLRKLETHEKMVVKSLFNADGSLVYVALDDGSIRVWEPESGRIVGSLEQGSGITDFVHDETAQLIYSATESTGLELWNSNSHQRVMDSNLPATDAVGLSFSDDRTLLGIINKRGGVEIWSPLQQAVIANLSIENHRALACAFSPDCRYVLSIFSDHSVRIWDISSGSLTASFIYAHLTPQKCQVHVNGDCVVAFKERLVYVWGSDNLFRVRGTFFPDKEMYVQNIANRPHGTGFSVVPPAIETCHYLSAGRFIGIDVDKKIKNWDSRNGQISRILQASDDEFFCVPSSSVSGRVASYLASISFDRSNEKQGYQLKVWNLDNPLALLTNFSLQEEHKLSPSTCAISRDGKFCVIGYTRGLIEGRSLPTGEVRYQIYGHRFLDPEDAKFYNVPEYHNIDQVLISPNGGYFVTLASSDSRLLVWDMITGNCIHEWTVDRSEECVQASFTSNGDRLVVLAGTRVISSDTPYNTMKIIHADSLDELQTFKLRVPDINDNQVSHFAIDPDDHFVAVTYNSGKVHVYDLESGDVVAALKVADTLHTCAWSEDRVVMIGGEKGAYFLWLITDGRQFKRFGRSAFDSGYEPTLHYFDDRSLFERKYRSLRSRLSAGDFGHIIESILYDLDRKLARDSGQSAAILNNAGLKLAFFGQLLEAQTVFQKIDVPTLDKTDKMSQGIIYFNKAHVEFLLGHYDAAKKYHESALEIFHDLAAAKSWQARVLEGLAVSCHQTYHFQEALQYYLRALPLHERTRNLNKVVEIKAKIGYLYQMLNDHENALKYMHEYLEGSDSMQDLNSTSGAH